MKKSLFTRLVSYSQNPAKKSIENFTTEVLAHLIDADPFFQRTFVNFITRGRLVRQLRRPDALPQQGFGNGIVDLVLTSGSHKVLVEVKISAPETVTKVKGLGWTPQIKKYLSYRDGHVAYLTTRATISPDVNSRRFLGHSYFEDLYEKLDRTRLTAPGKLFMDFMEENDMKPLEPFTSKDVTIASSSYALIKKCQLTLNEIVAKCGPEFRRLFRTRATFTKGRFSVKRNSAFAWTGYFRRPPIKSLCFYIEPIDDVLCYGVWTTIDRTQITRLNRHLDWQESPGQLYSSHPVKANLTNHTMINRLTNDLVQLKRSLSRIN